MNERAEGFWWVRLRDFGGGMGDEAARKLVHAWSVVQVDGGVFVFPGLPFEFAVDNPLAEWGPYLGTKPGQAVPLCPKCNSRPGNNGDWCAPCTNEWLAEQQRRANEKVTGR